MCKKKEFLRRHILSETVLGISKGQVVVSEEDYNKIKKFLDDNPIIIDAMKYGLAISEIAFVDLDRSNNLNRES